MKEFEDKDTNVKEKISNIKEASSQETLVDETETTVETEDNNYLSDIKGFIKDIVITIVIVFFVISFVAQPTTVDGFSMQPTLHDKDQLIIEKISERFSGFKRFDIIVFPYLQEDNKYFIKRIIGLPGETVNIIDGKVYINEELLKEPIDLDVITEYGSNILPLVIPEGHYFVMGDNRNHSKDSRYTDVGFVNGDDILGKAYIRLFPFNGFGFIQ